MNQPYLFTAMRIYRAVTVAFHSSKNVTLKNV